MLVLWKRHDELQQIIQHLTVTLPVGEFLVWDNRSENLGTLGRWLAVLDCRYPIVYTQDDDCIVENAAEVLEWFDGMRLSNALKPSHLLGRWPVGPGYETLVGWGAIFRREWIAPVIEEYFGRFPVDELSISCSDRIVTTLLRRPHNSILGRIRDFPAAIDPRISIHLGTSYGADIARVRANLEKFS